MFEASRTCVVLALAVGGLLTNAQAGTIDAIDAFGDSLSDVGNIYTATLGLEPAPPYANGQFSNGNIWVQDLALDLGLLPLSPSLLGGTDYAYGDAQSGTTLYNTAGPIDLTGPTGQIAQFEAANPHGADPNALYTIWIGANDLEAIPSNATSISIATDIGAIVENVDSAISTLELMGAKNFLVVTVPDLGATPDALSGGSGVSAAASAVSAAFDSTLVNGSSPILSLATIAANDGINISVLNTYPLLDSIVADPAAFGFTNVNTPCYTGTYLGFADLAVPGTVCSTPNQYVFWDGQHPTAAGQTLVADAALALVSPEPASVLLIAGGLFGMTGLFLLRRRYFGSR